MGRNIIARIVASNGAVVPAWRGQLSQLSITDYVECLRDRLPTKISGADFLSRFGPSGDTLTEIDSSAVYKVRSRTEHHIYENARSHQFVERMSRASRTRDRNALVESGEIMYASHWSYGQRCGLGSIETDRMVNLVRTRGLQSGIYGARISGRGAGGTVIILHEAADHSRQAIQQAMQEYAGGTGCRPTRLDRALTGSATWGVRIFE
jgi:L-arabinokinase